ncbi:MAG: hypothetical protein QOH68_874 [Nocardioidaceae bacterium]|jgi:enoyl-CoA hydratase/carnithine racemase|nr:hypothetical protein [Nocardioidaceae bacterium]
MARRTTFDEYAERYPDFALDLTDTGILTMRMHRDGGPAVWDSRTHRGISGLFNDIAGDRDVRVVIFTGTGDSFNANWSKGDVPASTSLSAEDAEELGWYGRKRHYNLLDIEAIMIAAVNGPVTIHSELAIMCDIVLASETAYFADHAHFVRNVAPGDGIHTIWPMVIGRNRFRYWQLTGQEISAQTAMEWGAVNEVLPPEKLADRARELAEYLIRFSPLLLRHTRRTFVHDFKRAAVNDLSYAQSMELLGLTEFAALGGGMGGLDRAWDDPELWQGGAATDWPRV